MNAKHRTIALLAAVAAMTFAAKAVDITYPANSALAFAGGTEYTEVGDEWGASHETPLAISITGTGNLLHGISRESNPWRKVNLTGDGYLTLDRNAQWSIAFGGSTTANFYGTLHLANISSVVYFGMNGRGDRSFENGSIVLEAGASDQSIYFSDWGDSRHIGDISTTGENASRLTLRPKNGGTVYVGYLNKNSTFGGNINRDGDFSYSLVKVGTGAWTVGGNVDILGTLTAQEGTLILNGTVSSAVAVGANGTLGGSGTISGAVSGTSGAKLAFTETDALTFTGNADLSAFALDVGALDTTKTYTVAKGTTSLPSLTLAQQAQGWIVKIVGGNVILENASTTIDENLTLTEDTDWTDSLHTLAAGVTVDLNGHNLSVAGVVLGAGASFVNTGAGKSCLFIGVNGSDKTWVYAANLPATIVPVFTGAVVEIPSDFVPSGGIGFADSATVQSVATDNCANGLYFLGNALVRGNEWQTSCSFPVTVEDEGNVMTISGANWVTYEAFVGTPFYGSGTLKLTTDWAGANLTIGSKEHANSGFFGRVVLDRGTMTANHTYNIRLEDDNNPGGNSFKNGTVALNNDADADACFKLVSQNWGTNPTYDLAALETSGAHPERVILIANRNDWNESKFSTVKIGRAEGATGEGVFAGAISNDNTSAASKIYLEKHGAGTWTLSGLVSPGGTLAVEAGAVNLAGATVADVAGVTVAGGAKLKGTSSIPAEVPVTLSEGAILSGGLTLNAAPTVTAAKYVPVFSANVAETLVLNYASPSLAAFTLEAETVPVVPVGTTWVIARGPEESEIVAPTLGATAVAAGWTVAADGNEVVLTAAELAPLTISGAFALTQDYDYSTGSITVEDGATVDLNGYTLKVGEITFEGSAAFVNGAAGKANLEVGYGSQDKSWLWANDNVTLSAGVRPVIVGEAVVIPSSYVPAGGIGFKDTVGDQLLYHETCANGLAFLGGARVKEPYHTWTVGTGDAYGFDVRVEGEDNTFTFDNTNGYTWLGAFTASRFSGDGELAFKVAANGSGLHVGSTRGGGICRDFAGTLVYFLSETASNGGVYFCQDGGLNLETDYGKATVVLGRESDSAHGVFKLHTNFAGSTAFYKFGSLATVGAGQSGIVLYYDGASSGGNYLEVGGDGKGGGTFAGTFLGEETDGSKRPYDINKRGSDTWTLTGTVANGGNFTVYEGTVAFNSGLANVSKLTVESGATAGFCGNMGAASAIELKSGSKVLLDVGAAADEVPVVEGDLDLTDVDVIVNQGSWIGNRGRDLLRVTGTLTVDLAKIATDLDMQHHKFEVTNGNTLRYSSTRGFMVIIQ